MDTVNHVINLLLFQVMLTLALTLLTASAGAYKVMHSEIYQSYRNHHDAEITKHQVLAQESIGRAKDYQLLANKDPNSKRVLSHIENMDRELENVNAEIAIAKHEMNKKVSKKIVRQGLLEGLS